LHIAAANKQTNAAQVLLSLRAKVNARADAGQTPLHVAARRGDIDMARLLLAHRAVPNVRDSAENTPLLLAVQSAGSDSVDAQFVVGKKFGMTNWAGLLLEQFEMVNLLLAKGAEANVRNRAGATALGESVRVGNEPVVNVLLRAGADPNGSEGATGAAPLHLAATRGHGAIVQTLLRARARVDAQDARGETPLAYALREGRTNTAALLRQAGGTIGTMRALSPTEKSLVDSYERTEMLLRRASASEKGRLLVAMNPTKADVERMFPRHAAPAWKVVDEINTQIKKAFAQARRDADENKEIWRIRPEPPGMVTQDWRARGWLATELPVFSLAVDKTGGTSRPGDFCFVNGHWVLVPPLRAIAAQEAAGLR
jgi:ankyrin repeat protein